MPKVPPLLDIPAGTKLVTLIAWKAANAEQLTAARDEEVTFLKYWDTGNYWMNCRNATGEEGILRTEFLQPQLEGAALRRALAGANEKLPVLLEILGHAQINDKDAAQVLVDVPVVPQLGLELYSTGVFDALCRRVADTSLSLQQLRWALGKETGALAYICGFVDEACQSVIELDLVPLLRSRVAGLVTGDGEVGVVSPAARSVQVLAKLARSAEYHVHVADKDTVKLMLEVLGNKKNALHVWKHRNYEKTWSIKLVFTWVGEYVSALALHEEGRKALRAAGAARTLRGLTIEVEGAPAKDYCDGTIALLNVPEHGSKQYRTWSRKLGRRALKKGGSGCVMISYSWATQPLAMKLKDGLQSIGLQVSIDLEKMEGNIMHRMAEAVEGASCIVLLYSQRYADSRNCNMEAQYVQQLSKRFVVILCDSEAANLKGDGGRMLNAMREGRPTLDMCDEKTFHERLADLSRELTADQLVDEPSSPDGSGDGSRFSLGDHPLAGRVSTLEDANRRLTKQNTDLTQALWQTQSTLQALVARVAALEARQPTGGGAS